MSDLFREVDEALQREKVEKLWKEYGPLLMACILLLILSTAAITGWRSWTEHRDQIETHKLIAAQNDKDVAAAMEKAAGETNGGHKAIALMTAAGAAAGKEDFAKATSLYDQVVSDKSAPTDLRDLATILYSRSALLTKDTKQTDYQAMLDKLLPVAKNNDSAFQLQAKLDAALLYGDGLKDYTAALALLDGFDADSVSDSLQEKASALKHVYEFERSKTPKA